MNDVERLVEELRRRGQTLSVAESCTGGLLGARITSVAGSSAVFWGGVISYDDEAKVRVLGVPAAALAEHGAVSRETARAMAAGVRALAGTTWAVAVTGIAGPGGGTAAKPVGTVWIGVEGPRSQVCRHRFDGDRANVRDATVREAIGLLASCVVDTDPNGTEAKP